MSPFENVEQFSTLEVQVARYLLNHSHRRHEFAIFSFKSVTNLLSPLEILTHD